MKVLVWGVAALVAGVGVTAFGMRALVQRGAPLDPDEPLPATPMQRLARAGLMVGGFLSAGLVALVLYFGPERTFEEDPIRIGFTVLLVLILVVFAFLALRLMMWLRRDDGTLDERDQTILTGSHAIRSVAVLLTLVVWIIGLQESFWSEGAVPVVYLNLVFWSCLVVSLVALPVGILIGYRRS